MKLNTLFDYDIRFMEKSPIFECNDLVLHFLIIMLINISNRIN